MNLLLRQKNKELFSASFELLEGEKVVGDIQVKGIMTSREVKLTGKIYDQEFCMIHKMNFQKKYRFYEIFENNKKTGEIYQKRVKIGFLAWTYVPLLTYKGAEYDEYGKGIGEAKLEGMKKEGNQTVITIYNDLYNYEITCKDNEEIFRTVIYVIYSYVVTRYKGGQKSTKSVQKFIYKD